MKKLMLRFKEEDSGVWMYELIAISESVDKLKARAIEHAGDSVYDEVWKEDLDWETSKLILSYCSYIISNEEPL